MIPEEYRQRVESFIEAFPGNKELARKALEGLFSILISLNDKAEIAKLMGSEQEIFWALSEIQQLICWTPLREFLREFAASQSCWIRSAAKGEIADQTGEFWGDPEIGLVSRANLFTMWQSREGRIYFGSSKLDEILQPSLEACLPVPGLRVTVIS